MIDYAIILFYMATLVVIGRVLRKQASGSMDDYFLAGRKMPWWLLGLSNMAAWLDMTGTMVITSFLFMLGPRGLYIEFRGGACLVLVFLMLWLGKWHRRSGVITGAEWIIYRFGSDVWGHFARLVTVVATVVTTVGMLAYSFKGAGLFLAMFVPFSPFTCTLIMVAITTLYTLEAGFYGVVFSDVFQSICIWIGVIFIVIMAVSKIVGGENLAAVAYSVTGNQSWTTTFPQWHTPMPKGYEQYSFLTGIVMIYLLKSILQGLGIGQDPKYFGARSDRDCGFLSFSSGWFMMLRWPLMLGFAILGLFLVRDLFPDQSVLTQSADLIKNHLGPVSASRWPEVIANIMNHPDSYSPELIGGIKSIMGPDWSTKISLLSHQGTIDPERILPAVILYNLPIGLRGLLIVALLAAAMSTFNALINIAAGFLTRDLYQGYIRPRAGNKELIYISYASSVLLVMLGMLMAYSTRSINDIWGWLTVGLVGGLSVPGILRLYWWRFNSGGFAIGTIVGLFTAVGQRIFFSDLPEMQQFTFLTTAGLIGSIIGTYLTKPTDQKVLEHFYKTTRPFGLWAPFKSILAAKQRSIMEKEHRNDLIAIPFALCWLVTMLMAPMQLMIGEYKSFAITLGLLLIALAGLYVFWYRPLNLAHKLSELEKTNSAHVNSEITSVSRNSN